MNVRTNNITHIAYAVLCKVNDHKPCCPPDNPCNYHKTQLTWRLATFCGQTLDVKGRPKGKSAYCLICLASFTEE